MPIDYREARLTKTQWRQALSALDNMRHFAYADGWPRVQWEKQAIWLLRAQMLVAAEAYEFEPSREPGEEG